MSTTKSKSQRLRALKRGKGADPFAAPKYQVILDDIKQGILEGRYAAGQYLPSQNELIERYQVATGTVRQALMILSSEGWVRPERGRGVFVQPQELRQASRSTPAHTRARNVGFAVFGSFSEYEPELQMVLHGATSVMHDSGSHLSFRIFPAGKELLARLASFLADVSSLIITRDVASEVADAIRASGVPTTFLDYHPLEGCEYDGFNVVACEAVGSGHLAAQMMAAYGHRRLAVFTPTHESREYAQQCIEGVRRACFAMKLPEPKILIASDGDQGEQSTRQLIGDRETTGVIVLHDQPACRLIRDLRQSGVRVPEDKSVISIGGLPREQLSEPHLARVNQQYHRLGAEAARVAIESRTQLVQKTFGVIFEVGTTLARKD